jgi:hypothetical protein
MARKKKLTIHHYINESIKSTVSDDCETGLYLQVTFNRKTTKFPSISSNIYTHRSGYKGGHICNSLLKNDTRLIHSLKYAIEEIAGLEFDVSMLNMRSFTLTNRILDDIRTEMVFNIHHKLISFIKENGYAKLAEVLEWSAVEEEVIFNLVDGIKEISQDLHATCLKQLSVEFKFISRLIELGDSEDFLFFVFADLYNPEVTENVLYKGFSSVEQDFIKTILIRRYR